MSETYSHETLRDAYECGRRDALAASKSEEATPEPAGQAKVVAAVPPGSLSVFDAETFIAWLTGRIRHCQQRRAAASIGEDYETAQRMQHYAGAYETALYTLRRLMESTTERQPEENS